MSKNFSMNPSPKVEQEKMKPDEIQAYLKNDGYDQNRLNVWDPSLTKHKYEELLKPVEESIEQLKKKVKSETRPIYQWEPFEDRLLIKPDEAPKTSAGGLLLTANAQEEQRPSRGTIILTGPGLPNKTVMKRKGYMVNGVFKEFLNDGEEGEALFVHEWMPFKKGDRVLYSKQGGLKITDPHSKDPNEYYLLMRVTDVFIKV